MLRRLTLIALTALVLTVTTAGSAAATTVVRLDLEQLVGQSDAIVVAEVEATEANLEDDGRVYTTVHFETTDRVAGKIGDRFQLRHVGGRDGDIATRAPGMPRFRAGERVFLFLKRVDGHPVLTGLSQGKFQIAVGPDGETDYVVPQIHTGQLVDPGDDDFDADSHEDIFRRVHDYRAFRQRVEAALKARREGDR